MHPHPTGYPSKKIIFLLFVRVRNVKMLRPWGPCPYHLPPPAPKPLDPSPSPSLGPRGGPRGLPFFGTAIQPLRPPQPSPATKALSLPPCPPGQLRSVPPPPHRASFKKHHFSFFVCVRNVKNTTQNLLHPWGPCPYHPRNQSPWTPASRALVPPPPHRNTTQVAKFAPSLGPVPLPPTPPAPKPLDPPPSPSLGPRGGSRHLLFSVLPLLQPTPLVYRPVHQASSGGYPPTPQGILQKTSFFLDDTSCEIRAPTTYPPSTEALGPTPGLGA